MFKFYPSRHHEHRYQKINLATAPRLVDLPPDQVLVLEQPYDEFIGITFTYGARQAGAAITHPNIARSRAENMEYKHSYRDWRRRDVVKHHLVFARQDVYLIIPDKPIWTYPLIEINQVECHLDTSGSSPATGDHREAKIGAARLELTHMPVRRAEIGPRPPSRHALNIKPREG
jgi:hypothetical protein